MDGKFSVNKNNIQNYRPWTNVPVNVTYTTKHYYSAYAILLLAAVKILNRVGFYDLRGYLILLGARTKCIYQDVDIYF